MTQETFHRGGEPSLKILDPQFLQIASEGVLNFFLQRMICRTAPATPGRLIIQQAALKFTIRTLH